MSSHSIAVKATLPLYISPYVCGCIRSLMLCNITRYPHTDIQSDGFKVGVLGTSAVQISWEQSQGREYIMSYHIYFK